MNRKTILNIFFAPTFIALLTFSVIFLEIIRRETAQRNKERVLQLIIPLDKGPFISAEAFFRSNSKKKVVEYILKGDVLDDSKLSLMRQAALQAKHSCDTGMYIKVHMRDCVTYGVVIALVNLMHIDKIKRYMLYKNDFYIIPAFPEDCNEQERKLPEIRPIYL